jgi:phosphoserine phosphatase
VRRLKEAYPEVVIDRFYSDSRADTPLAKLAREAFLVKGNDLSRFRAESFFRSRSIKTLETTFNSFFRS